MKTALELMEDHAKALTEQRDALAAASKTWREAYEKLDGEGTRQAMRIAALEAENEQLESLCQRWSESCTGCNGSQMQCVTPPETGAEP